MVFVLACFSNGSNVFNLSSILSKSLICVSIKFFNAGSSKLSELTYESVASSSSNFFFHKSLWSIALEALWSFSALTGFQPNL